MTGRADYGPNNYHVPKQWLITSLGSVSGEPETANPAKANGGKFLYVDIEAVDNLSQKIVQPKVIARKLAPSRARNVIRKNDVIISLVRPRLKNIALVPEELDEQWASTAFCVCRPWKGIDSRYLRYLFIQDAFVRGIKTYGDSPPSGHDDELFATPIPIPPSAEQTRIADRIDELFTDLDAGVAALERVKQKLKRYRSAVLHAAVTGRLTADWRKQHGPPKEPGEKLLARILVERRKQWEQRTLAKYQQDGREPPKNWQSRYVEPTLPTNSDVSDIPPTWARASLGLCFRISVGGTPSRSNSSYWNGGIAWVSSGEVSFCRINTTKESISLAGVENSNAKVNPPGTVLLGMIGEGKTRGQPAILDVPAANNQNAAAILVSETPVPAEFVFLFLWSQYEKTRKRASGGNQPALNAERVAAIPFPVPPLPEQLAIVDAVNEKLSQIDALGAEVTRGLARAARLRQGILKAAFEGKLVPQNPSDEPAEQLLARIRAEREAAANGKLKKSIQPKRRSKSKTARG